MGLWGPALPEADGIVGSGAVGSCGVCGFWRCRKLWGCGVLALSEVAGFAGSGAVGSCGVVGLWGCGVVALPEVAGFAGSFFDRV